MGVCGSGDEEVGEVGSDAGLPEVESARVILDQRMKVVINATGYLETNKAHNLLEISYDILSRVEERLYH